MIRLKLNYWYFRILFHSESCSNSMTWLFWQRARFFKWTLCTYLLQNIELLSFNYFIFGELNHWEKPLELKVTCKQYKNASSWDRNNEVICKVMWIGDGNPEFGQNTMHGDEQGMNLIQMKIIEYETQKCTKIDGPQSFTLSSLVKGFAYFKNSLYTFERTWKASTTISRL